MASDPAPVVRTGGSSHLDGMIATRDERVGGGRRFVLSRAGGRVKVPDEIRKCVGFLGYQASTGDRFAGTWFAFAYPLADRTLISYAVTARHVLEEMHSHGIERPSLRVNLRDGTSGWFETHYSDWMYSDTADVAVLTLSRGDDWDLMSFRLDLALTDDFIADEDIGPGDEVFVAGMLAYGANPRLPHGAARNVPIIRIGHIAAMREEPVRSRSGPMDAYLIELHSMGGLSGSPVFVQQGRVRVRNEQLSWSDKGVYRLMGLLHGHYDVGEPSESLDATGISASTINTGIGVVVPVEAILQLLEHPALVAERSVELEAWLAEGAPSLD